MSIRSFGKNPTDVDTSVPRAAGPEGTVLPPDQKLAGGDQREPPERARAKMEPVRATTSAWSALRASGAMGPVPGARLALRAHVTPGQLLIGPAGL